MLRTISLFLVALSLSSAAEVVLSPSGPIATPQAARDAARSAVKPCRIVVNAGVYPMTEALTLTAEDSEVTWEAAPGAKPIFSGGKTVTGWTKAEGGVWKAALPDKTMKFEQLWINGRRATRARMPNKGYFHITDAVGAGVFPELTKDMNFHAFSVDPEQYTLIKAIPAEQRDDVLITVTHAWAVGQCRIKALDDTTQSLQIKGRAAYPFVEFEPDQRYWMENFRAALDAPGEWYLDTAKGELLYLPMEGEDITKLEVIVPVADKFISMKAAKNVQFKGMAFHFGNYLYPAEGLHDVQAATKTDGAIEIEGSSGIRFENVEVAHVGRYGIYFIGDFFYTGVSAGWNWGYGDTSSRETLLENNQIHHLGWGYLSDMGGYYGLGTSPGTVLRGNHVHHIVSHRY